MMCVVVEERILGQGKDDVCQRMLGQGKDDVRR